jgi:cobalt/nickel transport system permease protein
MADYKNSQELILSLDARVKFIIVLFHILLLNSAPYQVWAIPILFFAMQLSLLILWGADLGFIIKRSLLAFPFTLAALPLIFSGKEPVVQLGSLLGWPVVLSLPGSEIFLSIVVKAWLSIMMVALLTVTTPFPKLLIALQQLKVPPLFIAVVGMMWRYLFVVRDEAVRLLRARSSRSGRVEAGISSGGTLFWRAQVTGGMAGSLLLRSLERSERVYVAMLSRGYNGCLPEENTLPLRPSDRAVLGVGLTLMIVLWFFFILLGQ